MKQFVIPAIVVTLLSATPAIAQKVVPDDYLNFSSYPTLCDGQILKDGVICVKNFSETQSKYISRNARLIFVSRIDETTRIYEMVRVDEIRTNEAGIAYVVTIDWINNLTKMKQQIARTVVRKDGSTRVDPKYGEYGQVDAVMWLERRNKEIRLLVSALK